MRFIYRALRARLARLVSNLPTPGLLLSGYAGYVVAGTLLLSLPICQDADVSVLDNVFTATSAVSTTGLVTVSTGESYSFWGELVVLLLFQLGGLGYMTVSSFAMLAVSGDVTNLRYRVAKGTIGLPEGFQIVAFLRMVVWFTLAIEALGAVALYPAFLAHGSPQPAWDSIFHSVSAFCTAGFGLYSNSFEDYRDDVWLNLVIMILSCLGAIGFIVLHDLWNSLRSRKTQTTLTTRIILWSTLWIIGSGTVLFALEEPAVAPLAWPDRWLSSLFQVMTASTTVGFNTVPIGAVSASSLFLLAAIMVIGASPSGTGGGLKTTTFTALWAEMLSVIQGRRETVFRGRTIPEPRMRAAVASTMFYGLTLAAGVYGLTLVDASPLPDQIFECASALGTVGLSRGITGGLTAAGKVLIIVLMYAGRVGPIAIILALAASRDDKSVLRYPKEDIVV